MSPALTIATALAREFEGFYSLPYLCPAGVPTVGYGATYYRDGRRVKLTDPAITRDEALALLAWQLDAVYLPQVLKLCPGIDTAGRLGALVDFAFNLGASNLAASTLRRKIIAGLWGEVPAQLLRWNKAGGVPMRGLTRRREAEGRLI